MYSGVQLWFLWGFKGIYFGLYFDKNYVTTFQDTKWPICCFYSSHPFYFWTILKLLLFLVGFEKCVQVWNTHNSDTWNIRDVVLTSGFGMYLVMRVRVWNSLVQENATFICWWWQLVLRTVEQALKLKFKDDINSCSFISPTKGQGFFLMNWQTHAAFKLQLEFGCSLYKLFWAVQ